ncbi:MAG: YybS family protein [Thermodesulfobacteriota bacterium]|nr:YybS family protein [Thermodesulfobacteriota bacterium]
MVDRSNQNYPSRNTKYLVTAISVAIFAIPAVIPGKFQWLQCFMPLPVFYCLTRFGPRQGASLTSNSILAASAIAVIFGSLQVMFLSFSLLPLGFHLAIAARKKENLMRTGVMGVVLMIAILFALWALISVVYGTNPYERVLTDLDKGIQTTYEQYMSSSEYPPETLEQLGQVFDQVRLIIPRIFPGLLISGTLFIVWLNLSLGQTILKRRNPALIPWEDLREWRLPDPLVWSVILTGVALFIPVRLLNTVGLNMIIILGELYFFQGLAVITFMFNKWKVPRPIRIFIYLILVIQAYGVVVVAAFGLADVWADFRKTRKNGT